MVNIYNSLLLLSFHVIMIFVCLIVLKCPRLSTNHETYRVTEQFELVSGYAVFSCKENHAFTEGGLSRSAACLFPSSWSVHHNGCKGVIFIKDIWIIFVNDVAFSLQKSFVRHSLWLEGQVSRSQKRRWGQGRRTLAAKG